MIPQIEQTLLFSATFPESVMDYAHKFCPSAHLIRLKRDELTVQGIKQMYMDVSSDSDKYGVLASLYGLMTNSSSIIFVKVITYSLSPVNLCLIQCRNVKLPT